MSKDKPTIEQSIRDYYVTGPDGDDWLVEKGKAREAKLLKMAVHRIDELKQRVDKLSQIHVKGEQFWRGKYDEARHCNKALCNQLQHAVNLHARLLKALEGTRKVITDVGELQETASNVMESMSTYSKPLPEEELGLLMEELMAEYNSKFPDEPITEIDSATE